MELRLSKRTSWTLLLKRIATNLTLKYFCILLQRTKNNSGFIWSTRPAAHQWPVRRVYWENCCSWASVSYLIYNEVSSLLWRWMPPSPALQKLTQGIQMFSFAVANMSRVRSLIQMCFHSAPHAPFASPKARTVNCKYVQQHSGGYSKQRQSMMRFNAWRRQLDLKGSRPLRIS